MWLPLADPEHAEFAAQSEREPLAALVRDLAIMPYADTVYAHWTHYVLHLGPASSYEQSHNDARTALLCVMFLDEEAQFLLGHGETPQSNLGMWRNDREWVQEGCWMKMSRDEVLAQIDCVVRNFLDAVAEQD